jgi:hypothetical protein
VNSQNCGDKAAKMGMVSGAFVLCITAGLAMAEMEHSHQMGIGKEIGPYVMATDTRQILGFSGAAQEAVNQTMREHLEALHAIVAALAREDYEKAAVIAHEGLGFPKHHQAMQREQGASFPPEYQKLAMAHHQVAEDLAKIIPSKDIRRILPHLEGTMKACVVCHQAFRL